METLHGLLKKFVGHAAPDRLNPEVAAYILGLRPPTGRTEITPVNPTSTEVSTSRPVTLSVNVGKASPIKPINT